MNHHRHIFRVEPRSPRSSGAWVVLVQSQGKKHSKTFTDTKYDGTEGALAKALAHRDELVAELGVAARLAKPENPNPGVSRTESERVIDGYLSRSAYWQAYWVGKDGSQVTKRFSVNKLGEEVAQRTAVETRERALRAIQRGDDPFLELPPAKAALWRYMDLTKFLAMLEDSALFFSSAQNFEDPYEGAYSQANRIRRDFILSRSSSRQKQTSAAGSEQLVVSCWHAAKHESAAMWSLYSKSSDAIAIRTTVHKLRDALPRDSKMGLVKYVDYTRNWIPENDVTHRYLHKRLSFQHEHELRALIDIGMHTSQPMGLLVENGLKVHIDLNRVIEEVYVSPKSASWFVELVEKVCVRYNLKLRPRRSSLYDDPIQ